MKVFIKTSSCKLIVAKYFFITFALLLFPVIAPSKVEAIGIHRSMSCDELTYGNPAPSHHFVRPAAHLIAKRKSLNDLVLGKFEELDTISFNSSVPSNTNMPESSLNKKLKEDLNKTLKEADEFLTLSRVSISNDPWFLYESNEESQLAWDDGWDHKLVSLDSEGLDLGNDKVSDYLRQDEEYDFGKTEEYNLLPEDFCIENKESWLLNSSKDEEDLSLSMAEAINKEALEIESHDDEKQNLVILQQEESIPQQNNFQEIEITNPRDPKPQKTLNNPPKSVSYHKIVHNIISPTIIANRLHPAVAAGDEDLTVQRGLWTCGLYGISNKNSVSNISGYKGKSLGGIIGFDIEIDNYTIGLTYSNVQSVFKFKTNKEIDKELVKSHVFSIYGQKELPKNFTLQSVVSAARNYVKDITSYSLNNVKYNIIGKYRNNSYNIETLLNYNYHIKYGMVVMPNIGLRYGRSHDGMYNESDINMQSIIRAKSSNIFTGIFGTKIILPIKNINKLTTIGLTLQASVEQNFNEKAHKIKKVISQANSTSLEQSYIMPKQPKIAYNIGGNIFMDIKNIKISLDYNHHLHKHYRSHQGIIKLKINF